MKLLNLKQTSIRQTDRVFRNPSLGIGISSLIMLVIFVAAVVLLVNGRIGRFEPGRVMATIWLLFGVAFAWMTIQRWRATRRETNWLVRIRGNEVLIKFRSFQNWKMSEEDVQVIELRRDEIAFVRQATRRQISTTTTKSGSPTVHADQRTDLEIGLKDPRLSEQVDKALTAERGRPGWTGRFGGTTKMLEYPVEIVDAGVIRLAWKNRSMSIRPKIGIALEELGRLTKVEETQKEVVDFTASTLKKLSEPEQREKLKQLAIRDRLSATVTAKELYNLSLADARKMVEELTKGEVTTAK